MSSHTNLLALSEQLLKACGEGSLETVRSLVPKLYNTPVSFTSPDVVPIRLAMATAAHHGQPSILQYFIESFAPTDTKERRPWDVGLTVPEYSLPEPWRIAAYSDIVAMWAIDSGNPSVVQTLLDAGMPVDHWVEQAGYPLGIAVSKQRKDLTKLLLEKGADANATTGIGSYPLVTVAATEPSVDIVKALVEHGADLSQSGALVAAAEAGNIPTAEVLLEKGSDINETRKQGIWQDKKDTPLHAAVRAGKTDMVKFLLDRGIKQDSKNGHSLTARDIAKEENNTEILSMLDQID